MIKSAQELLEWLEGCPDERPVELRYIQGTGVVAYSVATGTIDVTVLREMASARFAHETFSHLFDPAPEETPVKRLADPLRDPKLDWLRSK